MFVLVGVLSHSGRFRAWVSSRQDQAHLVEGIDAVLRRFGGTARRWRMCSRLPTEATEPQGGRTGVVEKAIHYLSQRWWRTADINGLAEAQDSLDAFCATVGDARRRAEATVGELADTEPLGPLPAMPYPAEGTLVRKVAANGLVSLWGNRYSVPPSVIGTEVRVRWRLGDPTIDVVSASGQLVAAHRKGSPRPRQGGSPSPAHRSPPQGRAGGVYHSPAPQTETEPASVSCSAGDRG